MYCVGDFNLDVWLKYRLYRLLTRPRIRTLSLCLNNCYYSIFWLGLNGLNLRLLDQLILAALALILHTIDSIFNLW